MTAWGAIGTSAEGVGGPLAKLAGSFASSPWWFDPFNRALAMRNQDSVGPLATPGGYFGGGTPVFLIPSIVANYGVVQGSVTLT